MRYFTLLLTVFVLTGCLGREKDETAGLSTFKSRIQMPTDGEKGLYDKNFSVGGKGDLYSEKDFKTGKFSGLKDYKTSSFSQAGKSSSFGSKMAKMGQKQSGFAEKSFSTKENSMGNKSASLGNQTFSGADSTFGTRDFTPAKRSMEKNLRPMIFGEPNDTPTAYTEDEVNRLLSR